MIETPGRVGGYVRSTNAPTFGTMTTPMNYEQYFNGLAKCQSSAGREGWHTSYPGKKLWIMERSVL